MHDQEKSTLRHSSCEAVEQSPDTGGGGGGAKGGDPGERGPAKHAPDPESGARDPGAGPRAASARAALRRHTPEVGAGCSNRARPDLCGGRPAMDVPTANLDPLLPFKIDPVNGREAPESGHRLNPSNAPGPTVPGASSERARSTRLPPRLIHVSPMVRFSGSKMPIQVRKGLGGWLASPSHRLIQDNKRAVR